MHGLARPYSAKQLGCVMVAGASDPQALGQDIKYLKSAGFQGQNERKTYDVGPKLRTIVLDLFLLNRSCCIHICSKFGA
jgi:hypothetical protein